MEKQIDVLGNVSINIADWDINEEFKARTITSDYSTWTAYISRKNVPAGTPITDTEYWKPICRLNREIASDYNTFKELLISQINELQSEIVNIISSIDQGTSVITPHVFYLGFSDSPSKIVDNAHKITGYGIPKGRYELTSNGNDKLYIIIDKSFDYFIQKIELGGIDVPIEKRLIDNYSIFESKNNYIENTYIIDINY